jgi:uncharacterized protein
MVIQEMTEQECRAMFTAIRVARLACARDNQPYIVPIHVDFDDDYFYSFSTLGMKIDWMRENPLVCLEMDDLTNDGQWMSVVVFGDYEELAHTPDHEGARRVAERLFQTHPMWWQPASVPLAAHEPRPPVVYRIRMKRVSGRRASPEPTQDAVVRSSRRPGRFVQVLRRLAGRSSN